MYSRGSEDPEWLRRGTITFLLVLGVAARRELARLLAKEILQKTIHSLQEV